ncbi:hypothetical protein BSLG_005933 [Batrachochytrium salamandrivorans]|nr:hypothetical protein BSLG_005933 [Batrachochytrium salamandrivorans]
MSNLQIQIQLSTANTCSIKVFPRTIQNHAKAAHLETKLEIDMANLSAIHFYESLTKMHEYVNEWDFIGVFELMQDDTYDYAFKFPQSSHFSKSNQSISANTDTAPHASIERVSSTGRLTVGQGTATKQDLEYEAMMEMKLVSTDLQKWVVDVIDNSVNLDPDILAEVNRMSELAAAAMTPGTEKHAVTGSQQIKSSTYSKSVVGARKSGYIWV